MINHLVRSATIDDAENIAKLYNDHFSEHILVHRNILNNPEYVSNQIKDSNQKWVVSDINNEIVGSAVLAMAKVVGLGDIERICVNSDFRGKGLANHLVNRLVEVGKDENLGYLTADARVNTPAMQKTFLNLGFNAYCVTPKFEIINLDNNQVVRELFAHMGCLLKPETVYTQNTHLIGEVKEVFENTQKIHLQNDLVKKIVNS